MASSTFRDSVNSLGWSRREPEPATTAPPNTSFLGRLQSLNPFSDQSGYVSLPTQEPGAPLPAPTRREEEEGFFARESDLSFTHPSCIHSYLYLHRHRLNRGPPPLDR